MLHHLMVEEDGQTLVEYGLLVALIALVVIAILTVLGRKVRDVYVNVNTGLKSTT
jgi:pilus assembly protein Flp/PilA